MRDGASSSSGAIVYLVASPEPSEVCQIHTCALFCQGCSIWDPCHTPSWLNLGELSHMHIHLTMDHDLTQLNTLPCVGNVEYSLTWTSLGRQGWCIVGGIMVL